MRLGLGHGLDVGYRSELFGATSYLLDTYTGAAAAYSLRQLRTGVTSVVRVRRSSDNAEADFTAAEVSNGTLTTWTGANDGFVVTWYDQSGNGNDVTNATTTAQPKIISTGVLITENNSPALQFDGSDDKLGKASFSVGGSFHFFGAFTTPSTKLYRSLLSVGYGASTLYQGINFTPFVNNALIDWQADDGFYTGDGYGQTQSPRMVIQNAFTISTQYVVSGLLSSSEVNFYINGSAATLRISSTADVPAITDDLIIGGRDTAGENYSGKIQEIIIYNSDQSANRSAIESGINSHYSIY